MPFLDDLQKAMQIFNSGVEDLARIRAIDQANQMVNEVRASAENEAKKRAQLQQISNQLVTHLAGQGVPATTLQQLASSFGPAPVNDVKSAAAQSALSPTEEGKQFYQDVAKNIDVTERSGEMQQAAQQQDWQSRENEKNRELQRELAGLKLEAKNNRPLTDNAVAQIQKYDEDLVRGKDILNRVTANDNLVGPAAARVPGRDLLDPEFASFKADVGQWFDAYRVKVTGAGASPGELKILAENRPKVTDPSNVFKAKAQKAIEIGNKVRMRYLKNLAKAGRDVSGFLEENPFSSDQQPGQAPTLQERVLKDPKTGQTFKAQIDSNGNVFRDGKKIGSVKK